jgi:hypothetical protein
MVFTVTAVFSGRAEESIIFSKPADKVSERANVFMDQSPRKTPGGAKAPSSIFSSGPEASYDILPGSQPPAPVSQEQIKQWQKLLDDKKNWILTTPEEIMGVPTAEKILGLPDMSGDDKLSTTERYMKNQERQRNISATNAMRRADSAWGENLDSPFDSARSERQKSRAGLGQDLPNNYGQLLNGRLDSRDGMDSAKRSDSPWKSAFIVVPAQPKPDPEQVASMERFRALMEAPEPEKPVVVSGYSAPSVPKVNPNMEPLPQFNPAGNSFTPMKISAARPTGIAPLPTITGQTVKSSTPQPKPLTKPPPWLSDKPQGFNRRF